MSERNVTQRDIARVLQSATWAKPLEADKWRLEGGFDDDGQPLVLVIALTGHRFVVVTVF